MINSAAGFAATASMLRWTIPHFEKMFMTTGRSLVCATWSGSRASAILPASRTARRLDDPRMRAADGAFYSSPMPTARQEGFYVWSADEVCATCSP
jgi:uncharacterized protein YyaL (SSP411 family)